MFFPSTQNEFGYNEPNSLTVSIIKFGYKENLLIASISFRIILFVVSGIHYTGESISGWGGGITSGTREPPSVQFLSFSYSFQDNLDK